MQFLKKHYDKIILSAVLVVLAVVALKLPFEVSAFRTELEQIRLSAYGKPAAFEPMDISTNKAVISRFSTPKAPDLVTQHKLFNPAIWRRLPDGTIAKSRSGFEGGLDALRLVQITELKLRIDLTNVDMTLSTPVYVFQLTNPDGRPPVTSHKLQAGQSSTRGQQLIIQSVEGPPADPQMTVILRLPNRPDETVSGITRTKPFERTVGYAADFFYPPSQNIRAVKKDTDLQRLAGDMETYRVTAVSATDATVMAKSTGVRRTIPLTPSGASRSNP